MARRRHHPTHPQRRAEFRGLTGLERARANHFLQRDDVGVDGREHTGDAFEPRPAVEAAAAMNIVGGHAHLARALRLIGHQSRSNPRSGLETGSFFGFTQALPRSAWTVHRPCFSRSGTTARKSASRLAACSARMRCAWSSSGRSGFGGASWLTIRPRLRSIVKTAPQHGQGISRSLVSFAMATG